VSISHALRREARLADNALKKGEEALDIRRRLSEPYMRAFPLALYISMHLALRNLGAVTREVEELAAITAEHGTSLYAVLLDATAHC
jgi:hypothetical protein